MPKTQKSPKLGSEIIKKHWSFLVNEINAMEHIDYLFEKHVLSEDDMEKISSERGRRRQTRILLRLVSNRDRGLKRFKESLMVAKYEHVMNTLFEEENTGLSQDDEEIANSVEEGNEIQGLGLEMNPSSFVGKLTFMSEVCKSDTHYRYRWLYFYLFHWKRTLKLVLFDDEIKRFFFLFVNKVYDLHGMKLQAKKSSVYHEDVRESFGFTAKLQYFSDIREVDSSLNECDIPEIKFSTVKDVASMRDESLVHVTGWVVNVYEKRKFAILKQVVTRSIMITDETGSKMLVRIFPKIYIDEAFHKMAVHIEYGILMINEENGEKEIHGSRFTKLETTCISDQKIDDLERADAIEESVAGPNFVAIEDLLTRKEPEKIVALTEAYILAVGKPETLLCLGHKNCSKPLEELLNGRIHCNTCKKSVKSNKQILVYNMRANIGIRTSEHQASEWMNVDNNAAIIILGMTPEDYKEIAVEEKDKIIQNVKGRKFTLKLLIKPYDDRHIYKVLEATETAESDTDSSTPSQSLESEF